MQATFKVYIKMYWNQSGKMEIFDTSALQDSMMGDEDGEEEDEQDDSDDEEENEEPASKNDKNNNKIVSEKSKFNFLI